MYSSEINVHLVNYPCFLSANMIVALCNPLPILWFYNNLNCSPLHSYRFPTIPDIFGPSHTPLRNNPHLGLKHDPRTYWNIQFCLTCHEYMGLSSIIRLETPISHAWWYNPWLPQQTWTFIGVHIKDFWIHTLDFVIKIGFIPEMPSSLINLIRKILSCSLMLDLWLQNIISAVRHKKPLSHLPHWNTLIFHINIGLSLITHTLIF